MTAINGREVALSVIVPFWCRAGEPVPYPGVKQKPPSSDNRSPNSVFMAIASAVRWLSGREYVEQDLRQRAATRGDRSPDHAGVWSTIAAECPDLRMTEYHDTSNPIPDVDAMIDRLKTRGVLILSLQLAHPTGHDAHRLHGHHDLSVFASAGPDAQVWETADGFSGFLTWDEVRRLLSARDVAIPVSGGVHLVTHEQHHCFLIDRKE